MALGPDYRNNLEEIRDDLRRISAKVKKHDELIEDLRRSEVMNFSAVLRPMLMPELRLDDKWSRASLYLAEIQQFGLLDE